MRGHRLKSVPLCHFLHVLPNSLRVDLTIEKPKSAQAEVPVLLGDERAARGPAGIYVREVEGVELGPENVALGAQGGVGLILFVAGARVLHYPSKGEVGVFGSLR